MTVGIVGLGLIGGSFAKAYSAKGHKVLAADIDEKMLDFALLSGGVSGVLDKDNISECDLVLICVYPLAAVEFMRENGKYIGKKPVVIDCCGTKRTVADEGFKIAEENGFTYAGGHPMAGTQFSGFKHAKADLYEGQPMVIVPPVYDDILLLDKIKKLLEPAGFGHISVTTADKHDEMIAFTSQLAHVVSNAYIKSPTAGLHKGFSAGSYKDLTRVAWLNPQMWAELFMENKDNLIREIDVLINHLSEYKEALENDELERLEKLLDEGRKLKEEIDG
ncbi:MAG: prephenate dehydrogenase [Firmicutes bacterium]|nr:prephenate dehydrogenase [Bacillota bacterium]